VTIFEAHVLTLTRPRSKANATTGETALDYADYSVTRQVRGMFQRGAGRVRQLDADRQYTQDAIFLTEDRDVQADDMLEDENGTKFRLVSVFPAQDAGGEFSHMACEATRDNAR
jgi:hypothetical protein